MSNEIKHLTIDASKQARSAASRRMVRRAALADVVLFFTIVAAMFVAEAAGPWLREQVYGPRFSTKPFDSRDAYVEPSEQQLETAAREWLKAMRLDTITNVLHCSGETCSAWISDVGVIALECDAETCEQR